MLDSHGGALVNLIHSYTDNGDPFVRRFTDELLEEVKTCYSYEKETKEQIEIFFFRCHVPSLPHFIDGCSPANCMILLRNSLCPSTPVWDPSHMYTLHHCQEELINSQTVEDFQDLILSWKTFQGLEKLA